MKCSCVIALVSLFVLDAHAEVPFPRVPLSIQQTYADGSSTKLSCPGQPLGVKPPECTFDVVAAGGAQRHYKLLFSDSGYTEVIFDYRFTSELGNDKSVSFPVGCTADDLVVAGSTQSNSRCRLLFRPDGDFLRPRDVTILVFEGSDTRVETRALEARKSHK